jgi:hypothetical protein
MTPNDNNTKDIKNFKLCPNHCTTWIGYNERLNRFMEAKSGEIHRCPKWKTDLGQQQSTPHRRIKALEKDEKIQLYPENLTMEEFLSMCRKALMYRKEGRVFEVLDRLLKERAEMDRRKCM